MLPVPRANDRPYRVALVCLGNICRSAMADVVLTRRVRERGLTDLVRVESFGTGGWHVGGPMDERAAATLTAAGYDATRHRARQFVADLSEDHDLVLAMDDTNHADLRGLGVDDERLRMFRDLDPEPGDRVVPDPYYGGDEGFAEVLAMVERTAEALADELARTLQPHDEAIRR